ncbi:hypothetical protein GBAR_LOCUS16829, partial [Geodia barretti]
RVVLAVCSVWRLVFRSPEFAPEFGPSYPSCGVPDNSPSCIPWPLASTSLLTVVADNKNLTLFLQSQGPPLRSTTALLSSLPPGLLHPLR